MKYAIYEDPITHRFAHLPLPSRFLDGDALPAVVTDRWFESHETAVAGLAELLDREDLESATIADMGTRPDAAAPQQMNPPPGPFVWFQQ